VPALRDLSLQQLTEAKYRLDPVSYRRAHHVISENQRTLDFAEALSRNDGTTLSQLMAASHRSMRDDFEITVPAIDKLVDLMSDVIGTAGGVRMTGGGFGGCVVALLPQDLIAQTQAKIAAEYPAFAGHQAEIFVCQASGGAFV
ncbi:MAG: galactokinase, partial [Chromatocurvus sp.]